MSRQRYNKSHLSHTCGHLGRVQTITIMPVTAGESLDINIQGLVRLAYPRQPIVSDCELQLDFFHVPYRHVYGQDWINFLRQGNDESVTFTGISVGAAYRNPAYLCLPECGATINRALVQGYNRIMHNFYHIRSLPKNPDDPTGSTLSNDFNWYPTTETGADNCRQFGRLAARLPHVLNGGNLVDASGTTGWETQDLTNADATVTAGATFDIRNLAKVQSVYKSEAEKAWMSFTYQDVMSNKWGARLNDDVDPGNYLPDHFYSHTQMLSGQDVNGTDDATLGTAQGKTMDYVSCQAPRKYFDEHGLVYVLAVLRYPLVHTREIHPVLNEINPSYEFIAGDVDIINNTQPVAWDPSKWVYGASGWTPTSLLAEPFGQHYRFQPNRVHPKFEQIPGYPFLTFTGSNYLNWYYYQDEDYSNTFQTQQLEHWTMQLAVNATAFSPIPDPRSSIFAGV